MSEEGEVGMGGERKARMRVKGKGRKEIEEILKVGEKRAQRVRGK